MRQYNHRTFSLLSLYVVRLSCGILGVGARAATLPHATTHTTITTRWRRGITAQRVASNPYYAKGSNAAAYGHRHDDNDDDVCDSAQLPQNHYQRGQPRHGNQPTNANTPTDTRTHRQMNDTWRTRAPAESRGAQLKRVPQWLQKRHHHRCWNNAVITSASKMTRDRGAGGKARAERRC